jgi:serine/threonine protein kinase
MEKYNKLKLLGSGAFGQAWLVHAKDDGKKLVMKEIKTAKVNLFFYLNNQFIFVSFNR